jgi:nitroreductase
VEVFEALLKRYSCNEYSDTEVSRDLILKLIDAATWAPNHKMTEPWRFHVIAGEERGRFGNALADWMLSDESPDPPDDDVVGWARVILMRTPATIVVTQKRTMLPNDTTDLEDYASCSCATQNLMLAAYAEGLGTKWITGRFSRNGGATKFLSLDDDDRIVGYIWLGYPKNDGPTEERTRKGPEIDWYGI